jgi:hypothetical protein
MNYQLAKMNVSQLVTWFGILLFIASTRLLAGQSGSLSFIRINDTNDLFGAEFFISSQPPNLTGAGFPPGAHTLLTFNQTTGANIVFAEPPKSKVEKVMRTAFPIADPINIAFDSISVGAKGFDLPRLFILDSDSGQLITIQSTSNNLMDKNKVSRFNVAGFGVHNPQGFTMNPDTGQLFVLDASNSRIVATEPRPGNKFNATKTVSIALPKGLGDIRGLAFNPADQHFYILNTTFQALYKLNMKGELVGSLVIAGQKMGTPDGMLFAPSIDPTDDPSIFHLYIVTKKGIDSEMSEWGLSAAAGAL